MPFPESLQLPPLELCPPGRTSFTCYLGLLLVIAGSAVGCQDHPVSTSPPPADTPAAESSAPAASAPGTTAPAVTTRPVAGPVTLQFSSHRLFWKMEEPPVNVLPLDRGFAILAGLSGNFAGGGEEVHVAPLPEGWLLGGHSQQPGVTAEALTIEYLTPALFRNEVKTYAWKQGDEPVRMLHQDEGLCLLSGISGTFAGYGEEVRVRLEEDGYWTLQGRTQQPELAIQAIGLQWLQPGSYHIDVQEHEWKVGQEPVRLLGRGEGLCFLGALSGNLAGGGEQVRIQLTEDGAWQLSGQSGQSDLAAGALAIRISPQP